MLDSNIYAALGCSAAPVLIGYDLTMMGSIIANEEFIKSFGMYDVKASAWVLPADRQLVWSIVQYLSAIAGAFSAGLVNDRWGRRVGFYTTIL